MIEAKQKIEPKPSTRFRKTVIGGSLSTLLLTGAAMADIPYPAALDAAAVSESRVTDLNREALYVGNGDLNALVWKRNGTLCLRVAKNDIWDARVDTSQDGPLLKVDVPNQKWSGGGYPPSWKKPYPTPRPAAIVRIGAGSAGEWRCTRGEGSKVKEWTDGVMAVAGAAGALAGFQADVTGDFQRVEFKIAGTANAKYYVTLHSGAGVQESGWKDSPATEETVAFASAGNITGVVICIMTKDGQRAENRLRNITLTGAGAPLVLTPGAPTAKTIAARLDLQRAVATVGDIKVRALADRNVFLIETDQDISLEEIKAGHLPAAELGETEGVKWLHMKMPGDVDYAGMEYAIAVAGKGLHKAVAVVTSWDTKENVRAAAMRLARDTANEDTDKRIAAHEAEWTTYWSASGVKLGDPDLQRWWYRMLYMLRCFSKPGVVPVGLWAFHPTDQPKWHGDYHHNYNAWQPFWTPLILNHPAQAEPWIDYMNRMLPRLKWMARATYDCEGAFVGIFTFAFEPDPADCTSVNRRQIAMTPYGYTLGMIGMSAQPLWLHHLYQPDRQYLETKIYPVIKEVALFYCSFAEKCQRNANGKVKFGPSYSPEHGGFGVYDVPFDLAFARYTLKAGIAGAEELGRDSDLVARFRKALDLLPDYPTAPDADGKPVVVDWTGCKFRQIKVHNIVVPCVPVFPGDQVTWFSPESEKELFENTLRQTQHNGNNSTIMLSVAKARLGVPGAIEEFKEHYKKDEHPNGMFYWPAHGDYLSESVGIAAGISEFLLQSVGDIIRVFPAWPKDKDASFTDLRAQGGFLVSAEQISGKVTKLEITSTVGGKLRLLNPWTNKIVEHDTKPNQKLAFTQ